MIRTEAMSLAAHLNRPRTGDALPRYLATAEPILTPRSAYWVLIRDAHTGANLPPIVNPVSYLERVRETGEMDAQSVAALEAWLRLNAQLEAEDAAERELMELVCSFGNPADPEAAPDDDGTTERAGR